MLGADVAVTQGAFFQRIQRGAQVDTHHDQFLLGQGMGGGVDRQPGTLFHAAVYGEAVGLVGDDILIGDKQGGNVAQSAQVAHTRIGGGAQLGASGGIGTGDVGLLDDGVERLAELLAAGAADETVVGFALDTVEYPIFKNEFLVFHIFSVPVVSWRTVYAAGCAAPIRSV